MVDLDIIGLPKTPTNFQQDPDDVEAMFTARPSKTLSPKEGHKQDLDIEPMFTERKDNDKKIVHEGNLVEINTFRQISSPRKTDRLPEAILEEEDEEVKDSLGLIQNFDAQNYPLLNFDDSKDESLSIHEPDEKMMPHIPKLVFDFNLENSEKPSSSGNIPEISHPSWMDTFIQNCIFCKNE